MAKRKPSKVLKRERKAKSARRKIRMHTDRPRLSVFRSSKNIYCQVIDDERGHTLAMASTCDKSLQKSLAGLKKTEAAALVGGELAKRAVDAGIKKVAFDRGPAKFHGRVKALAEAARAGGLEF